MKSYRYFVSYTRAGIHRRIFGQAFIVLENMITSDTHIAEAQILIKKNEERLNKGVTLLDPQNTKIVILNFILTEEIDTPEELEPNRFQSIDIE